MMHYSEDVNPYGGTTVLLLIIPNPSSSILPHSLFYRLFAPYGDVEKILIFEKSRIWKAFVEMGSEAAARRAQEGLNGTSIMDGGIMNVYFSTFKTVTLVNNNSGGVDYRQLKQGMQQNSIGHRQKSSTSFHSQPEMNYSQLQSHQYMSSNYPTVQQAYSMSSDDNYQGSRSGNQIDDLKYTEYPIVDEKNKVEQSRSRSTTQQTETTQATTGRKRLRLRKDVSSCNPTATRSLRSLVQHSSLTLLPDEITPFTKNSRSNGNHLFSPSATQNRDTSLQFSDQDVQSVALHIPFNSQEDEGLFDLIKLSNNDEYLEENTDLAEDLYQQEDRDIMNAFSNDRQQFNFMFSIPEVQVESSSPITKGQRSRRLQDLRFSDLQAFDAGDHYSQQQIHVDQYPIDPAHYVNPQFLLENQPSKVIYIRGLQNPEICPKHLFNLLSNCGNIVVIIFIRHKHSALIQFQHLSYAQNAKDHLNNLPFFGAKLKIFYSNYQEIQLPLPHSSPLTQVFIPTFDQYRFGEGRNLVFNPPGQVLHISNIQKEATINDESLRQIFSSIGAVLQIKFMHVQKQNKLKYTRSKHMALIKMASLEEALNAAAMLHGYELLGRNINISFTKSKL